MFETVTSDQFYFISTMPRYVVRAPDPAGQQIDFPRGWDTSEMVMVTMSYLQYFLNSDMLRMVSYHPVIILLSPFKETCQSALYTMVTWHSWTILDHLYSLDLVCLSKSKPVQCATVAHLQYIGYYGNMDPMENDPILWSNTNTNPWPIQFHGFHVPVWCP